MDRQWEAMDISVVGTRTDDMTNVGELMRH
jgi:hypothetical protein